MWPATQECPLVGHGQVCSMWLIKRGSVSCGGAVLRSLLGPVSDSVVDACCLPLLLHVLSWRHRQISTNSKIKGSIIGLIGS